jgi:hypothetical protein
MIAWSICTVRVFNERMKYPLRLDPAKAKAEGSVCLPCSKLEIDTPSSLTAFSIWKSLRKFG